MVHQGAFEGRKLRPFLRTGLAVIALTLGAAVVATGSASATAAGVQGPPCLTGTTYNKLTKMCETTPTHTCEAGFEYDSYTRRCLAPDGQPGQSPVVTCPEGFTLSEVPYEVSGGYYSYELCSGPHLRGRSGPT